MPHQQLSSKKHDIKILQMILLDIKDKSNQIKQYSFLIFFVNLFFLYEIVKIQALQSEPLQIKEEFPVQLPYLKKSRKSLLHIKKSSHDMIVLPTKIIHERRLMPIKDIIMRFLSLEENNVE